MDELEGLKQAMSVVEELYARRPEVYDSPQAAAAYGEWLEALLGQPDLSHRLWWLIRDHAAFFAPELVARLIEASWRHELFPLEEAWEQLEVLPLPAARALIRRLEDLDVLGSATDPGWDTLFGPLLSRWFSPPQAARRRWSVTEQTEVWLVSWRVGNPVQRVPEGQAAVLVGRLCQELAASDEGDARAERILRLCQALHHLLVSQPLSWPVRAQALERLVGEMYRPAYAYEWLVLRLHERGELPVTVLGGLRRLLLEHEGGRLAFPFDVLMLRPELNPGDPWADEVLLFLGTLNDQERAPWTALLRHLALAGMADQTQWLRRGHTLMAAVGPLPLNNLMSRLVPKRGAVRPRAWLDDRTWPPPPDPSNELIFRGLQALHGTDGSI